jgi:hypothetical protein
MTGNSNHILPGENEDQDNVVLNLSDESINEFLENIRPEGKEEHEDIRIITYDKSKYTAKKGMKKFTLDNIN